MRLKLFLSFSLIVIVSVTLVAVIARRGAVNEVRTFMGRGGMFGMSDLAANLENYYHKNSSWAGVQSVIDLSQGGPGFMGGMGGMMGQRVIVADASGTVVADSQDALIGEKLASTALVNTIPLSVGGRTVGYLGSVGGMSLVISNTQVLLGRLNRGVVLAGLIAGALGLGLALGLAYTLIRPIQALTYAAQKLAEGDLTQRVEIRGDDEIATLGRTFNQMADSLQQGEEARRAMTADIAHELRTPLAVQRANLEAMQDGVYPLSVDNLAPVIEQNRLLTHLVEDLRTLALADAGQISLERTPTDVSGLAQRVVERFQPQALAQQVSLVIRLPAAPLADAALDPIRVEQILTNLLSNAMRYTPSGGQIEVAIDATPSSVELSVHDTGPGIPNEDLPFIFGRFYRVDKSRNRAEGGSGLGLSIARQLARAHDGDLTVANHPSGGAVFTLRLPR